MIESRTVRRVFTDELDAHVALQKVKDTLDINALWSITEYALATRCEGATEGLSLLIHDGERALRLQASIHRDDLNRSVLVYTLPAN